EKQISRRIRCTKRRLDQTLGPFSIKGTQINCAAFCSLSNRQINEMPSIRQELRPYMPDFCFWIDLRHLDGVAAAIGNPQDSAIRRRRRKHNNAILTPRGTLAIQARAA